MISRREALALLAAPALTRPARAWRFGYGGSPPPSGTFTITPVFDSSWTTANPGAVYNTVIQNVASLVGSWISGSGTMNWHIGYNEAAGNPVTVGALTVNTWGGSTYTYSSAVSFLQALPTDSIKASAYAALPGTNPLPASPSIAHNTLFMTNCFAAAVSNTASAVDPTTGFGFSGIAWDTTADGTSCAGGTVSLFATAWHELTEALGRLSGLNGAAGSTSWYSFMDLFTYSASGTRNISTTGTRYLSADNGVTDMSDMNQGTGDQGDTTNSSPYNANVIVGFAPMATTTQPVRQQDVKTLSIIGLPLSAAGKTAAGI